MLRILSASIIIAVVSVALFSQTTLTQANNPVPGDLMYQVSGDTNGIFPGGSGTGQIWNYTNLVRTDSVIVHWLDPAATPYGSQFPEATVCALDTCYNYFKAQPSKFEFTGYFSHGVAVHFSDYESILSYPFSYGSSMNDNFAALINDAGNVIQRTGTVNTTGDASGTLLLPFGSYTNALRLKEIITLHDSSLTYGVMLTTTFTIYEWYVTGKKFSVFKIVYMTFSFPGFSFSRKNVYYNPVSSTIGILPISTIVPDKFSLGQNYPNPFNPNTKFTFSLPSSGEIRLDVYDIEGKLAATLADGWYNAGDYSADFDGSGLSSGIYFYSLTSGKNTAVRKMVLIK